MAKLEEFKCYRGREVLVLSRYDVKGKLFALVEDVEAGRGPRVRIVEDDQLEAGSPSQQGVLPHEG